MKHAALVAAALACGSLALPSHSQVHHGSASGHGGGFEHHGGFRGGFGPRFYYPGYYGPFAFYGSPYYAPSFYASPYYSAPLYGPPPVAYVERYRIQDAAPPMEEPQYTYAERSRAEAAPAQREERFERITLSARELFAFDEATLRAPQRRLDEIAAAMARDPSIDKVKITGHTDRIGSQSYNLKLSQRRADAVKAYLVGKGVAADRLVAIGRGKSDPVVQCNDRDMKALVQCLEPNRRVEVEQIVIERRTR